MLRRLAPGASRLPFARERVRTLATLPLERLGWTDVWAYHDQLRLRCSADGLTVQRSEPVTCAALGAPVLTDGSHIVDINARGTRLIIGMAETTEDAHADTSLPWNQRAWGLAMWSGRLFEFDSLTALGAAALEHPRPNAYSVDDADTSQTSTVRIRFDATKGSLHFTANNERWKSHVPSGVGRVVRPWVLFAGAGSPCDAVRLVATQRLVVMPPLEEPQPLPPSRRWPSRTAAGT